MIHWLLGKKILHRWNPLCSIDNISNSVVQRKIKVCIRPRNDIKVDLESAEVVGDRGCRSIAGTGRKSTNPGKQYEGED